MKKILHIVLVLMLISAHFTAALAAPTPSPSSTGGLGSAKSTPTPSGFTLPDPNGGGGGDPGGGDEGPDGPGTGDKENPPDQPPPPPQNDQGTDAKNIPVEVDPDLDKILKPKKEKVRKDIGVWTIVVNDDYTATTSAGVLELYMLDFEATKTGGATAYGTYTGKGSLRMTTDEASVIALNKGGVTRFAAEHFGSLTKIKFDLSEGYSELYPLFPKEELDIEELAPLEKSVKISKQGADAANAYVDALEIGGFSKNNESSENGYYAELSGKGYIMSVNYMEDEKSCMLRLIKSGD